jgi:excisionase family DNA binding protein
MTTSNNTTSATINVPKQELLNTKEMAKRIGVSAFTLQKWVREKKIPAYSPSRKIYLYDPQEVITQLKKIKAN